MLGVCIGSPPWFSEAIGISEVGYQPMVGPQTPWMRTHLRESSQLAHWQVRTFLTYRVLLAYGEVHVPSLHIASCGSPWQSQTARWDSGPWTMNGFTTCYTVCLSSSTGDASHIAMSLFIMHGHGVLIVALV